MSKIDKAIIILKALGLPKAQQNERSALTLLALMDARKNTPWSKAKKRAIRIHDILIFIQRYYGKQYAENTRETIRRQTIHQFEQAGIVIRNPDDPFRPTNSPKTVYTIADYALKVIRKYGTSNWQPALQDFVKNQGKLIERYEKRKKKYIISISAKRQIELEETLRHCKVKKTYISAFPDFREFKRHIGNIAWETEVWIEDNPDHMIHFNGPKFFTVYK